MIRLDCRFTLYPPPPPSSQERGQAQLNKMASQVTGNLLSINRQLAEQVDRSKQTLDVLGG